MITGVLCGVSVRALVPPPLHIHGRGGVVLTHRTRRVPEAGLAVGVDVACRMQQTAGVLVAIVVPNRMLWLRVHAQEIVATWVCVYGCVCMCA